MLRKRVWIVGVGILLFGVVAAAGVVAVTTMYRKSSCGYASTVVKSYPSPLYCFNIAKLPAGITQNIEDASFANGAVLFTVHDGATILSVSQQKQPPANQLKNFLDNVIPLHFDVQTPVGKGSVGATKSQTLASLPTQSDTWILVTAPLDYSPDRMTQLLKSAQAN